MSDVMALYVSAIHPLSIALALSLPLVRGVARRWRDIQPCFEAKVAVQDFANGLVFPTFVALIFMPMIPNLHSHLETHVLQIAGGIGVFHVIREVFTDTVH